LCEASGLGALPVLRKSGIQAICFWIPLSFLKSARNCAMRTGFPRKYFDRLIHEPGGVIIAARLRLKGGSFRDLPLTKELSDSLVEWFAFLESVKGVRLRGGGVDFAGSALIFPGRDGAPCRRCARNCALWRRSAMWNSLLRCCPATGSSPLSAFSSELSTGWFRFSLPRSTTGPWPHI
jgi:hypothetical protein